ncbi:MAG: hypothetical protein M1820_000667 [Bogoriella megaspora]|nr:MAG: hypothetical protein M1820_000667 [Bogoriella megaspora]
MSISVTEAIGSVQPEFRRESLTNSISFRPRQTSGLEGNNELSTKNSASHISTSAIAACSDHHAKSPATSRDLDSSDKISPTLELGDEKASDRARTSATEPLSITDLLYHYPIQEALASQLTKLELICFSQASEQIRQLLSASQICLKSVYKLADSTKQPKDPWVIPAIIGYNPYAVEVPFSKGVALRDLDHEFTAWIPPSSTYFEALVKRTKRGCRCAVIPSQAKSYAAIRKQLGELPVELNCTSCSKSICFTCWWSRICVTNYADEGYGTTRLACRVCVAHSSRIHGVAAGLKHETGTEREVGKEKSKCACPLQTLCSDCDADIRLTASQDRKSEAAKHRLGCVGNLTASFKGNNAAWLKVPICLFCEKPRDIDQGIDGTVRKLREKGKRRMYLDSHGDLHVASDYLQS